MTTAPAICPAGACSSQCQRPSRTTRNQGFAYTTLFGSLLCASKSAAPVRPMAFSPRAGPRRDSRTAASGRSGRSARTAPASRWPLGCSTWSRRAATLYFDADGFFASCEESSEPALHPRVSTSRSAMTTQVRSAEHVSSDGAHQDGSGWNGRPKAPPTGMRHRARRTSLVHRPRAEPVAPGGRLDHGPSGLGASDGAEPRIMRPRKARAPKRSSRSSRTCRCGAQVTSAPRTSPS